MPDASPPDSTPYSLEHDPDPALLAALDAVCFADAWDAGAFARLRESSFVEAWAVMCAGEPIAYACWQALGSEAELLRIGVVPARRNAGWGRRLLGRLLEHGLAAGWRRIFLEVRPGNAEARALYRRLGFRESGRRRGYYRDPAEDALVLSYDLRQGG